MVGSRYPPLVAAAIDRLLEIRSGADGDLTACSILGGFAAKICGFYEKYRVQRQLARLTPNGMRTIVPTRKCGNHAMIWGGHDRHLAPEDGHPAASGGIVGRTEPGPIFARHISQLVQACYLGLAADSPRFIRVVATVGPVGLNAPSHVGPSSRVTVFSGHFSRLFLGRATSRSMNRIQSSRKAIFAGFMGDMDFKSDAQKRNFRFVLTGLRSAGYGQGLLFEDYTYTDILASHSPTRVVPAAAFGRTPPSFGTACISVLLADRRQRSNIVDSYRAIGAPIAFEVDDNPAVRVSFSHVRDADRERFLSDFAVSWRQAETKPVPSATASFQVTPLADVWEFLKGLPTIGDIATLHRGVEWQPPFDEDKDISKVAKPGFRKGFYKVDEFLMAFRPPAVQYLSFRKKHRRGNAFDYGWEEHKVFVNAATVSRGGWRLAAFADDRRHCSSQRFIALWPTAQIPITVIAALLNGPVANAYVACRENKRDIRKKTVQGIPVPNLNRVHVQSLSRAVDAYQELWSDDSFELKPGDLADTARRSLLEIDAILLRAYNLPPRLERELLDFFRGFQRRVPFEFTEYFPANFGPNIPLWMYLTRDFAKCNSRFLLDSIPKIDDPALVEALTEVE